MQVRGVRGGLPHSAGTFGPSNRKGISEQGFLGGDGEGEIVEQFLQ